MRTEDVQIGELYHVEHCRDLPWRAVGLEEVVMPGETRARRLVRLQQCDRAGKVVDQRCIEAAARDLTPWAAWWGVNGPRVTKIEAATALAEQIADRIEDLALADVEVQKDIYASPGIVSLRLDEAAARVVLAALQAHETEASRL